MGAHFYKKSFFSKLAALAFDVLASVRLVFFYATDFRGSKHSKDKVYEVCILSGLSWSAVSIGTRAASYKRLVQVSPIFSAFYCKLCGTFTGVFV